MNDRPEREDGEIERLRAEVAALRGKLRWLECAGSPSGDGCPDCRQDPYELPLLNPFSLSLLVIALSMFMLLTMAALFG